LLSTKNFLDSLMDLHQNQLVIRRKVNEKQKCSGYYFDIEFCGSKYCRKRKTFQTASDIWRHYFKIYSQINQSRKFDIEFDIAKIN